MCYTACVLAAVRLAALSMCDRGFYLNLSCIVSVLVKNCPVFAKPVVIVGHKFVIAQEYPARFGSGDRKSVF